MSREKRRAESRIAFIVRGYRDSPTIAEKLFSRIDSITLQDLMVELYKAKKFILYAYLNEALSGFDTNLRTAYSALKRVILTIMASIYEPEKLPSLWNMVREYREIPQRNVEPLLKETNSLSLNGLATILYNEKKFVLYACVREASLGFYRDNAGNALKQMILTMLLSVYDPKQLPDYLRHPSRKRDAERPDLNGESRRFHEFLEDLKEALPPD